MGQEVDLVAASLHRWGDVDCNGAVDPIDGLKLLRYDAGLEVQQKLEGAVRRSGKRSAY